MEGHKAFIYIFLTVNWEPKESESGRRWCLTVEHFSKITKTRRLPLFSNPVTGIKAANCFKLASWRKWYVRQPKLLRNCCNAIGWQENKHKIHFRRHQREQKQKHFGEQLFTQLKSTLCDIMNSRLCDRKKVGKSRASSTTFFVYLHLKPTRFGPLRTMFRDTWKKPNAEKSFWWKALLCIWFFPSVPEDGPERAETRRFRM